MSESIGICINISDKRDIDEIISEDIAEFDNRLTRLAHSRKELKAFGANPDELIRSIESRKSKLKNLLVRVRKTPECK